MDKIRPLGVSAGAELQTARKPLPTTQNPELAAQQFEALLLKQMIDSMWSTVPKDGLLSGSSEESMYRDMLNEALATSIAEGRGVGVKEVILRDINKLSKKQ